MPTLTYANGTRDLSIRGTITPRVGSAISIGASDIVSYSINSQIGGEGLPLGGTEAASFQLELSNVGRQYKNVALDDALVQMEIAIKTAGSYVWSDFGEWYVETSTAPEQSVTIQLSGYDALASRFAGKMVDNGSYPMTHGALLTAICAAAGVGLKSASFLNSAASIATTPGWDEDITLRDVVSYIATCAGGFARIDRSGDLEIVSYADGSNYTIGASLYHSITPSGGNAFTFNAIEAYMTADADDRTRFAVVSATADDPTNTIQIDYNPLLTTAIVNNIVTAFQGLTASPAELTWGGDPAVMPGDFYTVTMLDNSTVKLLVNSQALTFDGGLSVTETCQLPSSNTTDSASYSTGSSVWDANGNIRASRISGLTHSIIGAVTDYLTALTSSTAGDDSLLGALVTALNYLKWRIKAKVIDWTNIPDDTMAQIVASIGPAITGDLGDVGESNFSSTTVYNNTLQSVGSVQLAKGSYIIEGMASFGTSASGYRELNLSSAAASDGIDRYCVTRVQGASSKATVAQVVTMMEVTTSTKTIYLNLKQTSGSDLTVLSGIRYTKIR